MKSRGFTLVELVIIIAMVCSLTFWALPGWVAQVVEDKKAHTQDTTFHNSGHCMQWQDASLARHAHCKKENLNVR